MRSAPVRRYRSNEGMIRAVNGVGADRVHLKTPEYVSSATGSSQSDVVFPAKGAFVSVIACSLAEHVTSSVPLDSWHCGVCMTGKQQSRTMGTVNRKMSSMEPSLNMAITLLSLERWDSPLHSRFGSNLCCASTQSTNQRSMQWQRSQRRRE